MSRQYTLSSAEQMKKQADQVYAAVQAIAELTAPLEEKVKAMQELAAEHKIPVTLNFDWNISELEDTGGDIFRNWDSSNC